MSARLVALAGAFALIASTALGHHPGVHLNEAMAAQEPDFEPLDHVDAPEFDLITARALTCILLISIAKSWF